jgi:GTP cyclohydrolase I
MQLLWGERLDSEGMQETPERVARHWAETTWGLRSDPALPLQRTFPCDHGELVLIRDIPFSSLCEHHLLPFFGMAHVAYIPQERVVGLSKIPRCLDILAARPQMQEQLTWDLAHTIEETLHPLGVLTVLEAEHTCMQNRGVLKTGAMTTTQTVLGIFKTDAMARSEVLSLIRK